MQTTGKTKSACIFIFGFWFVFLCGCPARAEKGTWETVVDSAEEVWDSAQQEAIRQRINDLPGNPNDVRKENVWSATAMEIYNERREVLGKLQELDRIEDQEKAKYVQDSARMSAVKFNKQRLRDRLAVLEKERYKRIVEDKWYGFVPEKNEDEPPEPPPPPDPNWGGPLPEVNDRNPTTMGRSEIESEMKELNEARDNLRKRVDHMNSVGPFAGSVGQKAQVEDTLKKIVARLNALEAEKQNQIKNGTWGYSSDDITRIGATPEQIAQAYKEGKELGEKLRNSQMSMDEVRQATKAAYGRYQNNDRLKLVFKEGMSACAKICVSLGESAPIW